MNNGMKAKLVMTVEGRTIVVNVALEDAVTAFGVRGFAQRGTFNRPGTRAELQGAPTFKGLLGPMFESATEVRYECPASYVEASR